MPIPPSRNIGDAGHVNDHNDIAGELTALASDVGTLQTDVGSLQNDIAMEIIGTYTVTNAATLTQDGIFTSDYPNYRIYLQVLPITGNTDTHLRLRASSSDTTSNYFSTATGSDQTGAASNYGAPNAAYGLVGLTSLNTAAERNTSIFEMANPQAALETVWTGTAFYQNNSGIFINRSFGGFQDASTQFDGIKIYQSSGNITATMKVWGIRA